MLRGLLIALSIPLGLVLLGVLGYTVAFVLLSDFFP